MIDKRRIGRYERIYTQLKELIEEKSPNLLAAMATVPITITRWKNFILSLL